MVVRPTNPKLPFGLYVLQVIETVPASNHSLEPVDGDALFLAMFTTGRSFASLVSWSL